MKDRKRKGGKGVGEAQLGYLDALALGVFSEGLIWTKVGYATHIPQMLFSNLWMFNVRSGSSEAMAGLA